MHSSTTSAQRQEFLIKWNSHLGSIGAAFPQLLAGQRFVDVTLACEGNQVHCHRLVLAACSSYFESILAENPCKHPVIILPSEIKLWEIQALVDFMYKGEVNVTQAGLPQLLRCAEQLRIRGLYGSDAALNLNQLKAMTNKSIVASSPTARSSSNRIDSGGGGGAGTGTGTGAGVGVGVGVIGGSTSSTSGDGSRGNGNTSNSGNIRINDSNNVDTDENTNNSTTTTNTTTTTANTPSVIQQQNLIAQQHQQLSSAIAMQIKKEPTSIPTQQTNGTLQQHQQIALQQKLMQQQQMQQEAHLAASIMTSMQQGTISNANSNVVTEDDDDESGDDDSNSNQYDEYTAASLKERKIKLQQQLQRQQQQQAQQIQQLQQQQQHQQLQLQQQHDSTIEEDHNYVATHDEDDSYGTINALDTEHESSANSSLLMAAVDTSSASYKRVRRSEASLAQAAKCVSKGQTFQTVSNMFNIPVSTIRFYMARKGILPKRKRGRGASNVNIATSPSGVSNQSMGSLANAANLAQTLSQLKRSDSPEAAAAAYHLMGYKQLSEQQGAMI